MNTKVPGKLPLTNYCPVKERERDRDNSYDSFEVKDGSVVGHITQKLSAVCSMFLQLFYVK